MDHELQCVETVFGTERVGVEPTNPWGIANYKFAGLADAQPLLPKKKSMSRRLHEKLQLEIFPGAEFLRAPVLVFFGG
jgi:hypothetical protein